MADRRLIPATRRPSRPAPPIRRIANKRWATTPDSVQAWGWYVDGEKQKCDVLDLATERAKEGEGFVWLGLKDPTDEDMSRFARQFDLHPLAIEDAVEGHTRSKLEQFGDTLFCVISTVAYVDHEAVTETSEIVSTGQIMVFLGENFVMTVRRGENTPLYLLRQQLEREPEDLALGPAYVLYKVLDRIVDDYMQVVSDFETDIDEVEEDIFAQSGTTGVDRVYNLKRELIEFKRSVVPLAAPLSALSTRTYPVVPPETRAYFREVADHHTDARESILSFDEVLSTILQAGLARVGVADNQDMRRLSAVVAVLAVPTTLGAVYGMNFDNMPELHTRYGYFVVLAVMVLGMAACIAYFRDKGWL
ncbi:MAG TPA: magnesium/cobalt transporter CorA [Candidatus Luteococcus avicola]|nr:magnesium/cobalt transporter CorA [Candidatus Luteococcus avicola]